MTTIDPRPALHAAAPPLHAPPAPTTLAARFDATAAAHPARLALDADDRSLTYAELTAATDTLADELRDHGIGPGDRVGVRIPSGTADLYIAILGILRAGAAYVPVDHDDPAERAEGIFAACGVAAVVGERLAVAPHRGGTGAARLLGAADDAWIIFTSGSTGAPKGVAVSHASAAAFVAAEQRLWTVRPEDRVLAGLSVGFDASCEEMWLAWGSGAALVPAPRAVVRSGADLGPWLVRRGVTVVSTVPTLAGMWDDRALSGVRLLILGGEALPEALAWRLAAGREVWNTYGPTEATVVSTAARVLPGRPVTIGEALDGWEVAVVDEDGRPVPDGEEGELVIAGVGLARYLDPSLDATRYAPLPACGWDRAYRSGDMVRRTPDGIAFVGRRDRQVKIGGRRLELGEVEAHVGAVEGVRAAVAVVRRTDAGSPLLVAYVAGDVRAEDVRTAVAPRLPAGLTPVVAVLDALPTRASGKVDTAALPWPVDAGGDDAPLTETEAWLADAWREQVGPFRAAPDTDFFALGGTSVAVARLVSRLRARVPAVAVADVYEHRTLGALAARLDAIGGTARASAAAASRPDRRWGAVRSVLVLAVLALVAPEWVVGVLAVGRLFGAGPRVGWAELVVLWLAVASPAGRTALLVLARKTLLRDLRPGRYPRASSLATRVWFVERLAERANLDRLGGTPWAIRAARAVGADVDPAARLGTIPMPGALVHIGAGATIEPDVDLHGWWFDGAELVVGEVRVEADARVGTRALLMPGAVVGAGAEVEPGSVVEGTIPPGDRWAGSPARRVGRAGEEWPEETPPPASTPLRARVRFAAGFALLSALPLAAFVPALAAPAALGLGVPGIHTAPLTLLAQAAVITPVAVVAYALLVAAIVRATGRLVRPGWHADDAPVGWALWLTEHARVAAGALLFPLMASIYTRGWLRLMGISVGRRTEVSTVVGLSRLVRFGARSFAADDVVLCTSRARGGWLHVSTAAIGDDTFLGNGALVASGATIGDGCLVGVLTTSPATCPSRTSWLGAPALELPRIAETVDAARTIDPPRRLVLARAAMDLLRILGPNTASLALGLGVFVALERIGLADGVAVMAAAAPLLLVAAGVVAVALTVAVKWAAIGRYEPGHHPLWSSFVWRDELVNSAQEQLAGAWLMSFAIGTPLMSAYLRALGARVGRDVWCETMALTEFDVVDLADGAVVNRRACVETHLFHDRVLQIGGATFEPGATLGPSSATLPDTVLGAGCTVGGRSVVLRGEELPAGTRWTGVPVVAA